MENLPSILQPDLGLLFWMFTAFLVVFLAMWKFGLPAIVNMVEERKRYIDESLLKAHEASERLDNIRQEGEALMAEAREKQAQILQEAAATRDTIVEKAQAKAAEDASRMLEEARRQIDSEKQNAIRGIRSTVAELSVQIAEKVLRERLSTDGKQMELIDKLLDDATVGPDKE